MYIFGNFNGYRIDQCVYVKRVVCTYILYVSILFIDNFTCGIMFALVAKFDPANYCKNSQQPHSDN